MAQKPNRPIVEYRVEVQKRIEINRSYKERRNQASALRILSYGLFGKKRYQNLYLNTSLNCFYYALRIANAIHSRVPGLAMIVKFEDVDVIQYYEEQFQGKSYESKKFSRFVIKLTKDPSEEDKLQPGYNAGLKAEEINDLLTEVIQSKAKRRKGQRSNRPNRKRVQNQRSDRDQKDQNENTNSKQYKKNKNAVNQKSQSQPQRHRKFRDQKQDNDSNKRRTNYRPPEKEGYKGFKRYAEDFQNSKQNQKNNNRDKSQGKGGQSNEQYQRGQKRSRGQGRGPTANSSRNQPEQERGDRRPQRRSRNQDED